MKGILLVNLGSPKSTEVEDVKTYLDEFLMDERVIDYRWFFRNLLVRGIILKTRPKKSAEAYRSVWTDKGSPLIVITQQIKEKLQPLVDVPVAVGMRYAEPSIETGIRELVEKGVDEIVLFPLYPQYAMSTTETVIEKAKEVQALKFPNVKINYVPAFYDRDIYIDALAKSIEKDLPQTFDKLHFSYHGVPERHLRKTDPTKTCRIDNCCQEDSLPAHKYCYRHQCFRTTELVRERLGLSKDQVAISFQSRLGSDKWIEPYTDKTLETFPENGVKKIAICCPAFVSDCLETLEEIAIEGKEQFTHAGGQEFKYIPCMNDQDPWIQVVKTLCEEQMNFN